MCKTQSLLLTYFRTLREDGKLFERIGVLFLLLTFVSLFSRIGYGKVFFYRYKRPTKKDFLEFCFVCLFLFVLV